MERKTRKGRENKDDSRKWVSYGGSRQTKMRKSANKDENGKWVSSGSRLWRMREKSAMEDA